MQHTYLRKLISINVAFNPGKTNAYHIDSAVDVLQAASLHRVPFCALPLTFR